MRKVRKKKKISFGNIFVILIIFVFGFMFIFSVKNIFDWKDDADKTTELTQKIDDVVSVLEIEDNDETKIIEQDDEILKFNPYWDYIKMNLIEVDFSELSKINDDTIGWIQVHGTNINYPFVQTSDNDYYLNHSFDKSYNDAGWVFMDYRNDNDEMDKNTIIYAHGRFDKTMFGSLINILNDGWLNDSDNFVIKMSTEYENTLWQVFSIYRIPTTNDYLQINFDNVNEFLDFSEMLINRSDYDFNTSVYKNDKILTLSTCYNNNEKMVVHAKLIKKEDRN